MAINADFIQIVEVFNRSGQWVELHVSDMSINESVQDQVPEIGFTLYGEEINIKTDIADALDGNPLRVTQTVNNTSITFYCILASINSRRVDHYDVYSMTYYGQEELLTRRRFFHKFSPVWASGIIIEALNIYNENAPFSEQLTTNGVDFNFHLIGNIVSNYHSAFEIIQKVCAISGWVFKIEDGDCKFFDPATKLGLFDISYNQNIVRDTLSIDCDFKDVINVAIGEAYIYDEIVIEQTYEECLETIFIDKYDSDVYEIVEPFKVIQPEVFSEIKTQVNLDEGSISFETPLVYDVDGEIDNTRDKQDINFLGKMLIRRRVLARAQNETSISLFGERFSAIQKNDSGEDLETVFAKLQSIIQQRAFPVVSGKCDITKFGLRSGDFITVDTGTINPLDPTVTGERDYSFTARVTSIDHSTYKNEIRAEIKFSNSFFSGQDAMMNLEKRVDRLEKDIFDTKRLSGEIIRETGYIFQPPKQEVNQEINWSESTSANTSEFNSRFETGMQITFDYS